MNIRATLAVLVAALFASASGLPLYAGASWEEQSKLKIDRRDRIKDPEPPAIEFHNYGLQSVVLTNTWGATAASSQNAKEGATLKATPAGNPYITVDGFQYDLAQFHFHTPSKHAFAGNRTDMEVHFVHVKHYDACINDRPLVVLGGLIDAGKANPELAKLFTGDLPPGKGGSPAGVMVDGVNLLKLIPKGNPEWRYEGGLSAPNDTTCSGFGKGSLTQPLVTGEFPESVNWFLYDQKLHLSTNAIDRFRALFPEGNSRSIKELNGQTIYSSTGNHTAWR